MAMASEPETAVCERSSVLWAYGSSVGSQSGAYAAISRPAARHGYMFSTAIAMPDSFSSSATPSTNPRA